jgi:LysR family transcriptional regulator for metE and metH
MRNVSLKQLRVLAAVVRTGSVTGAAQRLNVSPPAVTLQMQLLQEQVGLPLVERSSSGTFPTDAGREIIDAIEHIEVILADCGAKLAEITGTKSGTVSVGVISTAKYFAPRVLGAFTRSHPGIELFLTIGNRSEIIEGLRRGEIEIAIMGRPPNELDVDAEVIGDHPHVIVTSPDHPLAGQPAIDPGLLAHETFLVREPGSGTRSLMEKFFVSADIAPRIGMQIASNETIKQAVIAGLGIAFISGHTVEAELLTNRLVTLQVQGLPIVRQWHVVHLRPRRLMPAAAAVRDFFIQDGGLFLPNVDFSAKQAVEGKPEIPPPAESLAAKAAKLPRGKRG